MQLHRMMKVHPKYDYTDVRPFVFSTDCGDAKPNTDRNIISCPFPLFSIELDGKDGVVSSGNGKYGFVQIHCILCKEITPGEYELTSYGTLNRTQPFMTQCHKGDPDYIRAISMVNLYLDRLQSKEWMVGEFKSTSKGRYKVGKKKKTHKPNSVIYISHKRKQTSTTASGHYINWDTSWDVRAHWRRLQHRNSYGLDRQGKRVVLGFTWIKSYVVGDETKVKTKVRKVV